MNQTQNFMILSLHVWIRQITDRWKEMHQVIYTFAQYIHSQSTFGFGTANQALAHFTDFIIAPHLWSVIQNAPSLFTPRESYDCPC